VKLHPFATFPSLYRCKPNFGKLAAAHEDGVHVGRVSSK
jgi:hypothetical protein